MDEISVRKLPWRQWAEVAPTWERIHNMCPDASFFLSREWVHSWLAVFGSQLRPDLLAFVRQRDIVGFCLLVWRTQWTRGIPLRRVYLNCAGENEADSTCIEYNSILSLPECAGEVAEALGTYLRNRRWDELILPGVVEGSPICAAANLLGASEVSVRPSHYVDLSRIRRDGVDLDSVFSAKTRKNIRRNQRAFEAIGGQCTVCRARSAGEGIAIFRDLAQMHQAGWSVRGRPGVFSSHKFVCFHEALIRSGFDNDRILLFQVRSGPQLVGALYCFSDRGWVRFYQSGFNYSIDSQLSPGLLTLYLSIRHCISHSDFMAFDFLAGDSQYKRALATDSRCLCWIVVRRLTAPSLLFLGLRRVKRSYVHFLKKGRQEDQRSRGIERCAYLSVPDFEI